MIYFIKAVYYCFLLPPGIFIIAFILLGTFSSKKQKKKKGLTILPIICGLLLYLLSTGVIGDLLLRPLEHMYTPPNEISGDVLVMLGGGGVTESPNVGFKGNVAPDASNRLLTIISIYKKTGYPIILSGGTLFNSNDSESNIAAKILYSCGIPKEKIILEDMSHNTEQNADFTAKIIKERGFKKPILVTSAYHMPRAVREFESKNVKVIPYPAGFRASNELMINVLTCMPASDNLDKSATALKEYIGIIKLIVFG